MNTKQLPIAQADPIQRENQRNLICVFFICLLFEDNNYRQWMKLSSSCLSMKRQSPTWAKQELATEKQLESVLFSQPVRVSRFVRQIDRRRPTDDDRRQVTELDIDLDFEGRARADTWGWRCVRWKCPKKAFPPIESWEVRRRIWICFVGRESR